MQYWRHTYPKIKNSLSQNSTEKSEFIREPQVQTQATFILRLSVLEWWAHPMEVEKEHVAKERRECGDWRSWSTDEEGMEARSGANTQSWTSGRKAQKRVEKPGMNERRCDASVGAPPYFLYEAHSEPPTADSGWKGLHTPIKVEENILPSKYAEEEEKVSLLKFKICRLYSQLNWVTNERL